MSFEVKKLLSRFGPFKEKGGNDELFVNDVEFEIVPEDILDLSQIKFDNDETWLYESTSFSQRNSSASINPKFQTGILTDQYVKEFSKEKSSKDNNLKNINTQTFTRPKKKLVRPSIEKYNQELLGEQNEASNSSSSPDSSGCLDKTFTKDSTCNRSSPLQFDLTQSANSHYFDKIAANAENEDTFQNMSPPSLVNSMCSSTFTNLMESSLIKNDPILKQICDTDFTTSILSQGSEPSSLIQSLNYSTNSVDEFLTRMSQDDTLKSIEMRGNDVKCSGDASYIIHRKDSNYKEDKNPPHIMDFEEYHDASDANFTEQPNNLNGTYRKNNRLSSATFRKTDFNRTNLGRNHTYEIDPKDIQEAQNVKLTIESPKSTKTLIMKANSENIKKSNSMENLKNVTVLKDSCNNELKRYDSKENDLGVGTLSSKAGSKKSLDCSIGSADSLDRMSTLSSSSKGSNKMLNMEEVEAIAEKQEQSLQIMSTPKPNWSNKMLNRIMWDHSVISPIVGLELQSDSGESSDEYKSAKSTFSKNSVEANPVKQTRSLVSLQDPADTRKLKSLNTLVNEGNLGRVPMRGSASNLHKLITPAPKIPQTRVPSAGCINTNLKTMKPSLKGSYTSLRPVNAHLPVAPPINGPSQAQNNTYLAPANPQGLKKGGQGNTAKMAGDAVFVKPNGPLRSGLPRPTSSTNIPRPASRIPGPRR